MNFSRLLFAAAFAGSLGMNGVLLWQRSETGEAVERVAELEQVVAQRETSFGAQAATRSAAEKQLGVDGLGLVLNQDAKEVVPTSNLGLQGAIVEAASLLDETAFLTHQQEKLAYVGVDASQAVLLAGDLLEVEELRLQYEALGRELQVAQGDAHYFVAEELGEEKAAQFFGAEQQKTAQSLAAQIGAAQPGLQDDQLQALTTVLAEAQITAGESPKSAGANGGLAFPTSESSPHYLAAWRNDRLSRLEGEKAYLEETLTDPELRAAAGRYFDQQLATLEGLDWN